MNSAESLVSPLRPLPLRITIAEAHFDDVAGARLLAQIKAARSHGARAVIVDFSRVEAIDSPGISALASIAWLSKGAGRVVLCSLRPEASRFARVTCLHHLLAIYATAEAALDALLV